MNTDNDLAHDPGQDFERRAASLKAGVAAAILTVIACFGAAILLSGGAV